MYARDWRDVIAGGLLGLGGLAIAAYAVSHYSLGTLQHMGPGMFPAATGVVLVGASSQAVLARELAAGSGILNLVGETSLTELVGVLKGASAAIGPDSGPGHVAAALGVPYLALIGPTAAARVAPYGSEELVVESHQLCAPCYQRRCPGMQERCMREIRAEMVWEKLQVIINEESQHA